MEELRKKLSQLRARKMHEYSGSNLYVKNLDDTVDEKGLRDSFEKFGEITSVKIALDENTPPVSKGFGFVCFKDAEAGVRGGMGRMLDVVPTAPRFPFGASTQVCWVQICREGYCGWFCAVPI